MRAPKPVGDHQYHCCPRLSSKLWARSAPLHSLSNQTHTVSSPEQAIATLATKTEANTVLEEEKTANFRIHHLTSHRALTESPYPLPRDRGPRESRRPVTARHVDPSRPCTRTHHRSLGGEAQIPAGGPSKRSTSIQIRNGGRFRATCRPQSWAHIQIQLLLVPKGKYRCTRSIIPLITW
jgi:hypothetical protein